MVEKFFALRQPHLASILGVAICVFLIISGSAHFFHAYQPPGDPKGSLAGFHYIAERRFADIEAAEMTRRVNEGELGYVTRINEMVHQSTYHCNPTDYSLSAVEFATSRLMKVLGFRFDWRQGLFGERMLCGFCHQRAIILARVLESNGIPAAAFGLNGHVVTLVQLEGAEYLVDPDFGALPYRYDVDDRSLRAGFDASYANVGFDDMDNIFEMVASREDNELYYSPEYLDGIQVNREILFSLAPYVAAIFIVFGVIGLSAFLLNNGSRAWRARSDDNIVAGAQE